MYQTSYERIHNISGFEGSGIMCGVPRTEKPNIAYLVCEVCEQTWATEKGLARHMEECNCR